MSTRGGAGRTLRERLLGRFAGDDRGSMAPLVPIVALVLLLLAGLVIDASRLLNARGRAVAYAEEAARAGASAIDQDETFVRLDETEARFRAAQFCQDVRAADAAVQSCEVTGIETVSADDPRRIVVAVAVQTRIQATLLGIIGIQDMDASGQARARPIEGTTSEDVDSEEDPVVVPSAVEPEPDETVIGPGGPPAGPVPVCDASRPGVVEPFCVPRRSAAICPPPGGGTDPAPPFCIPRDQVQVCNEDGSPPDPTTSCLPRDQAPECNEDGSPPSPPGAPCRPRGAPGGGAPPAPPVVPGAPPPVGP